MHDGWGFEDPGWKGFLAPPAAYSVYIDSHLYQCFGGESQQPTPWLNIQYACNVSGPSIREHTWADWSVVGEWSLATG